MKPFQVALLVVAGAVGGAVVMKVMQRPQPAAPATPAPVVAQNPAPAAPPQAEPVAPAPAAEPALKPEPFRERTKAHPKPKPVERDPEPVARNLAPEPAPVAAPAVAPAPSEVPPPAPRQPESVPTPPPPPPPRQVTLNPGMVIPVRLIDGLSTERNNTGDAFTGTLDQPLVVDGLVIAERGARVEGRVTEADKGGRVKGVSSLAVQLTRVHLSDGQTINVQTEGFERKAEQTHKTDAEKVGAGAAIGAIIGAIAGGGKGAAIGAGVGGGAGAGDVALTRGKPATIASETVISFRLSVPVTITERQRQ